MRRFRDIAALHPRVHSQCLGCVSAPAVKKHKLRGLEEGTATQSEEFAVQRSRDIEVYLSKCASHPVVGRCEALRTFLSLQDDLGTAWPEVSSSSVTRVSSMFSGMDVKKVRENTL